MDPELHTALQRLETKVDVVDDKLDGIVQKYGPELAVLTHRVSSVEDDLKDQRARQQTALKEQRDRKWAIWVALFTAFLALLAALLQPLLQAIGKG